MKIPVVNEQDQIIMHKERDDITLGDIFRITAIWITDKEGNILLAQRSFSKKSNPGKWGPAVAGTVEEGESYEENAYKELKEEIGLEGLTLAPVRKILYTSNTGIKYCYIFNLVIDKNTKLEIQKEEVEQTKWFSKEELKDKLLNQPEDFVQALVLLKEFFSGINENQS
ncbi:MAG: hypothetical protein QG644_332 [Patescibacteria group bacterium]|nr:hypothetical protein [Patescibacteria group bacterium]